MKDPIELIKHLLSGGSLTDGIIIVSYFEEKGFCINGLFSFDHYATPDMIGNKVDITLSDLMKGRWEIYWSLDNVGAMKALADHHYVESFNGDTYVMTNGLMVYDRSKEEFVPCTDNPFTPGTRWEVQE